MATATTSCEQSRPPSTRRLLCLLPSPPPFSGPEIHAEMVLRRLAAYGFSIYRVSTNVHADNSAKGHVTLRAILNLSRILAQTIYCCLTHRPALAYMYMSQNWSGFLRDAAIAFACFGCGVPVAAHVHGGNFGNFYAHSPGWFRFIVLHVLRRLRGLFLLAERFHPQFDGLIPRERRVVLYNAVEVDEFSHCLDRIRERRHSGMRVLYVGHLSFAKGFADALRAVPLILARAPEVTFDFVGQWILDEANILFDEDGRRLPQVGETLLRQWEVLAERYPRNLRLLGTVSGAEKSRVFMEADVFLFPSYSEGFPIVILEAMAAGLPLVATPVGALAEVLENGVNGYLVKPGDVEGLAEAVLRLEQNAEDRVSIGLRNRSQVIEKFLPDAHVRLLSRCLANWAMPTA